MSAIEMTHVFETADGTDRDGCSFMKSARVVVKSNVKAGTGYSNHNAKKIVVRSNVKSGTGFSNHNARRA